MPNNNDPNVGLVFCAGGSNNYCDERRCEHGEVMQHWYKPSPRDQWCVKCRIGKHLKKKHNDCLCPCWMEACTHDPLWSAPGFCVICRSPA